MHHPLSEIKNKHVGDDIYIIGSDASMNFVDKNFFNNKLCISVNTAHKYFPCKYTVIKDMVTPRGMVQHLLFCKDSGSIMITSTMHPNGTHLYNTKHDYYVFNIDNWGGFVNTKLINTDTIVNSHSTITSAIHVAYYLGAANIILCGIDCGMIDDEVTFKNYYPNKYPELDTFLKKQVSHPYHEWNIKQMRNALKANGCNMYSLNPFINIGLEGHKYSKISIPDSDLWAGKKV